jgi:dihydrofolate synthase / folylpolyglutamate synthase
VAVVEVGLGGRLDATNVLDPLVSGVTNVGSTTPSTWATLEEIAFEKAGIFKPGVPALVGAREPEAPLECSGAARRRSARRWWC